MFNIVLLTSAFCLTLKMLQHTIKDSSFILKDTTGSHLHFSGLTVTEGRLPISELRAGCGGCRPRCGDRHRAGRVCPVGSPSPSHPSPAPLRTHEAPAGEAPSCQSEAESGRRQRACTGASGSPGRGRVWLILARTRASPPACWAPMGSSRCTGTSSPTHCRTTAG